MTALIVVFADGALRVPTAPPATPAAATATDPTTARKRASVASSNLLDRLAADPSVEPARTTCCPAPSGHQVPRSGANQPLNPASTGDVVELAQERGVLLADALDAEQRERRRLSEALHDSSIQNLLSARHLVQEAESEVEGGDVASIQAALAQADESIAATVGELRDAIFELHPYVLEQAGLGAALTAVSRRVAERGGFYLDLDLGPVEGTGADRVLLAATQELLANADEHAAARRVRVQLRQTDGNAVLCVSDDGKGFDSAILPSCLAAGHIGIASQRTRVQSLGGTFDLGTSPGQGTEVTISIPHTSSA